MKVIIAGSRTIKSLPMVEAAVRLSGFEITEVVSGMAPGVDSVALEWAAKYKVPVKSFYAKWKEFGPGAGFLRNRTLAGYADALIAVWDGESKGTKDMIAIMSIKRAQEGKRVYVYNESDDL